MARVLGRVRLSRSTEESTSEARQRDAIEQWARLHDHQIVGWAVDMDVSGSVSPFEAPALGPRWLHDRADEWDVIVAWKLDRLGRTLFALNDLFRWCGEHGKTLACISDQIDLSTWTGRLVASVIAGVAEGELEAIRTRTQASQTELRRRGRWHGGTVPLGYRKVPADGGGWVLEIDHDTAPMVRDIAARAAQRESIRSIAERLQASGVPAPRGGRWTAQTVTRMLRSRWIIGQAEHGGKLVIDETTGLPLQRAEPLISLSLWQEIQSILDDRKRPKKRTNPPGLLLNIAECGRCHSALYHNVQVHSATGKTYRYWRCSGRSNHHNGCAAPSTPAETLRPLS